MTSETLRNKRIILLNGLLRNAYASSATIFVNSLFISSVGGQNWPRLYFWIQILTLSIFIVFLWLRKKSTYFVYTTVLTLGLAVSVAVFVRPHSHFLIYALGVFVVTSDLLGNIINNSILSGIFNPHELRELDQKLIPADLAGRLLGAFLIEVASRFSHSGAYHFTLWTMLGLHVFCFQSIVRYWSSVKPNSQKVPPSVVAEPESFGLHSVLRTFISSPVVQISLVLMLWNQCVKFITQALYYNAADHLAAGIHGTTQLLSRVNLVIIAATYLFQRVIGKKIVKSRSPSYLFKVMPVGFIVSGLLAFVAAPYWMMVFQFIHFAIINKAINAPMTRQCLFSVPERQREKTYFLITVFTSIFIIVTSGLTSTLKHVWGAQEFLVLLILISVLILFALARLDFHYVKSLWRNFNSLVSPLTLTPSMRSGTSSQINLDHSISLLRSKKTRFWDLETEQERIDFLHVLYEAERTHPKAAKSPFIFETLNGTEKLNPSQREVWSHLHQEFLKGTRYSALIKLV